MTSSAILVSIDRCSLKITLNFIPRMRKRHHRLW